MLGIRTGGQMKRMRVTSLTSAVLVAMTGLLYGVPTATAAAPSSPDCSAPAGPDVNWAGCDKMGANLGDANLSNSDLVGTNFADANLSGANLTSAYLPMASFYAAKMGGAVLNQTNMQDADLSYASMSDVSLVNGWIIGAKVYGTYLAGANLKGLSSGGNHGTPAALPPRWTDVAGYLVGPYAQLGNAEAQQHRSGGSCGIRRQSQWRGPHQRQPLGRQPQLLRPH